MAEPPLEGLKQLADRTGLSISTVSRVLSGKAQGARISDKTRDRVLKEARRQGIVINEVARGLRLRISKTVGLIIPDISNPFFATLARQVEHVSRARNYSVLLCDSEESTDVEAANVHLMTNRRVDGLIVAPVGGRQDHLEAAASIMPLVLIDRILPGVNVPCVASDNEGGGELAVRHLVAMGHRRIGCVQGLPASSTNAGRIQGFRKAAREAGLEIPDEWIAGEGYTLESAKRHATILLSSPDRPTAIVAMGNSLALGVLHAARDLGISVPEELSLVGFDDQPWAEWLTPPLTTIAQPVESLGASATELFFTRLEKFSGSGEAVAEETVTLPMFLIARGSVSRKN